jgi:hypothetical protein
LESDKRPLTPSIPPEFYSQIGKEGPSNKSVLPRGHNKRKCDQNMSVDLVSLGSSPSLHNGTSLHPGLNAKALRDSP